MKHLFSLLTFGFSLSLPLSLYATPNYEPSATEKQITTRQQQQQSELNSAIQSQQVQAPNVRLEAEKTQSTAFPANEDAMLSHSSACSNRLFNIQFQNPYHFPQANFPGQKVRSILRAILLCLLVLVRKELTCYYAEFKIA